MRQDEPRFVNPEGLDDPSRYYSHVVVTPPGARMAYIAGQYGADEAGRLVSDDYAEQVRRAFVNLRIALHAVGAKPSDVVRITVLIVNHDESKLGPLGEQSRAMWGDRKPTSTLIPVPRLARDGMLFEIDAIAVVPHG